MMQSTSEAYDDQFYRNYYISRMRDMVVSDQSSLYWNALDHSDRHHLQKLMNCLHSENGTCEESKNLKRKERCDEHRHPEEIMRVKRMST